MSRVHYNDGYWEPDANLVYGRWEGRVKAVLRGKPAQRHFLELEAALLALPRKRLLADTLCDGQDVCALGAIATYRGEPVDELAVESRMQEEEGDTDAMVNLGQSWFGMTETLAWLIVDANDSRYAGLTHEARYEAMLRWVRSHVHEPRP